MSLEKDRNAQLDMARERLQMAIEKGICDREYVNHSRYRVSFSVITPGGHKVIVQIGANDEARQKGGIRISLNPSRLVTGDIEVFHKVMKKIVGGSFVELLAAPLINRIDVAVDIRGVSLSELHVTYSNAQRITMFGKEMSAKGKVETYHFGSVSSDYMAAAYEKNTERADQAIRQIAKLGLGTEGLKANVVRQLKTEQGGGDIVRVEIRGKKLRGAPIAALSEMPNRFERMKFIHLDKKGRDLSEHNTDLLRLLVRYEGIKAAKSFFKETKHANAVNAYLKASTCEWWSPEEYWGQACSSLMGLGLFPPKAFDRKA